MRVVICDTVDQATARVADVIAQQVAKVPHSVLGLATGGTMEPLYDDLRKSHVAGLSFAGVTAFNLDEYVGLPADHPQSYATYMRKHLFDHIDIDLEHCFIPSGMGDPIVASRTYEAQIAEHGPIDLQLLGLGKNGHIGFNEPGSSLASLTREKVLSQDTLTANRRFFADDETMPSSAITMGIQTICNSKKIVLLALGQAKAKAVQAMIEGPVSAFCPASALQMHANTTVVVDAEAAALLEYSDHYIHAERLQRRREQ